MYPNYEYCVGLIIRRIVNSGQEWPVNQEEDRVPFSFGIKLAVLHLERKSSPSLSKLRSFFNMQYDPNTSA